MSDCKHELKRCPRCQSEFECKSGSILLCQCHKVNLTEVQLEYIYAGYDDCLCFSCLVELRSECNQKQFNKKLDQYFS